jgi:hypothetical protein
VLGSLAGSLVATPAGSAGSSVGPAAEVRDAGSATGDRPEFASVLGITGASSGAGGSALVDVADDSSTDAATTRSSTGLSASAGAAEGSGSPTGPAAASMSASVSDGGALSPVSEACAAASPASAGAAVVLDSGSSPLGWPSTRAPAPVAPP